MADFISNLIDSPVITLSEVFNVQRSPDNSIYHTSLEYCTRIGPSLDLHTS